MTVDGRPCLYVGIDTSAYTASVAILDERAQLWADVRRRVEARPGAVGVRQSEAFFQHIRNLPELFAEPAVRAAWRGGRVRRVVSSGRPRPVEDSYMPVFQAARSAGRLLAAVTEASWTESTHQEGHLFAALYDERTASAQAGPEGSGPQLVGDAPSGPGSRPGAALPVCLLFLHVSGGTTELVAARRDAGLKEAPFRCQVIGGSLDLKAGQFVDRVARRLGLGFPGGPALERLAEQEAGAVAHCAIVPPLVLRIGQRVAQGPWVSFSGPAAQVDRWVQARRYPPERVAWAAQACLEEGLSQVLAAALPAYPGWPVYVVGGVAANQGVRRRLTQVAQGQQPANPIHFARPERSVDNAVGLAYLGWWLDHGE